MSEYIITDDMDVLGEWMPKLTEIVRCRDCRFFRIGTNTDSCGFTDKYAHPNGFCAWGERE